MNFSPQKFIPRRFFCMNCLRKITHHQVSYNSGGIKQQMSRKDEEVEGSIYGLLRGTIPVFAWRKLKTLIIIASYNWTPYECILLTRYSLLYNHFVVHSKRKHFSLMDNIYVPCSSGSSLLCATEE